jgi:hypothetical protein
MTDLTDSAINEADAQGAPLATPVVAELKGRFHRAIERFGNGEPVRYDLYMLALPTEQRDEEGNAQIVSMIALYMEIKGARLGTAVSATRVFQPNGVTDSVVEQHVRETLTGLMEYRTYQLAQEEANIKAAAEQGKESPAGGWIMPPGGPQAGDNPTFDDIARAMNGFARGE